MLVTINDSGDEEDYMDTLIKGSRLEPGDSITKAYDRESKRFDGNVSMILWPYFGYPDLAGQKKRYLGKPLIIPLLQDSKPIANPEMELITQN